ncbi:hypothetical protein [Yinghuangia sp. YIM S09857]|uniref:hypothetical protein n=1 Tax=Yinghuangia sp. YIM S09857 TaxID=3436929 RepID=UPI003F52FD0D
MTEQDYPLALALEDLVPVAFTGVGVAFLVGHLAASGPAGARTGRGVAEARVGAALVVLGGSAKAVWKVVVAADGPDHTWLESLLFPCLGTGFSLLALALLKARDAVGGEARRRTPPLWAVLGTCAAAVGAAAALRDTWPALILTVLASTVTAVTLVLRAKHAGDIPAAALFGGWLAGMLILGPLAGRSDQTIALQWVEQLCNTVTQGAFAVAAWRLARRMPSCPPSLDPAAVKP